MIDEEQLYICHECVGDEFLKKEIRAEGKRETCSYCKNNRKAVQLKWLAENIHGAIERHFGLTSYEPTPLQCRLLSDKESDYIWDRSGEHVNDLIQNIAGVDLPVANDVQEYLSYYFGGDPTNELEENPYGEEACYAEYSPDSYPFQESWDHFCREITYRARFFSQSAEKELSELFSNLDSLRTDDGKSVIRVAGPNTENPDIFRARVSQSQDMLKRIIKNPVQELGAPPPNSSKSSRMNAEGISVFYGSTDADTCIAEARPPIGSQVIVGRFQIIREIRLLDLNRRFNIIVKGSYFDPEFKRRIKQASFFANFVTELTKPVMPDEETLGYLPSQVVAEYLAEKVEPHLDGIIFNSSQTKEQGQNVILFHRSCGVKSYKLPPGTQLSICDYGDSITVLEEIPKNPQAGWLEHTNKRGLYDYRDITLHLDVKKDIEVMRIEGVKYDSDKRSVLRIQSDHK